VELSAVCYSDIAVLYLRRGGAFPSMPYRDYIFEYPVGTGAFVYGTAAITAGLRGLGVPGSDVLVYFSISALLLGLCGAGAIWFTSRMPGARRGDVPFLAVGLASTAFVNWDLLTVGLTAAAMYAWARDGPATCGLLLGWAAATKAYPALLLVPLLLVCIRERRFRAFAAVVTASVVTWLTLNAAYLLGPLHSGWSLFYTFSFHRDADLGTIWNLLGHILPGQWPAGRWTQLGALRSAHWPGDDLNLLVSLSLVGCTIALCVIALLARRPPSLGQLSFLMIAAFLLTSKSWSPQYGLWLLPFAVLSRLPWRVLVAWLALDIAFYVGGMWYVNWQIDGAGPQLSLQQALVLVGVHWAGLAAVCACVIRDILRRDAPRSALACA
jgi:uncharacterized membrane protein